MLTNGMLLSIFVVMEKENIAQGDMVKKQKQNFQNFLSTYPVFLSIH